MNWKAKSLTQTTAATISPSSVIAFNGLDQQLSTVLIPATVKVVYVNKSMLESLIDHAQAIYAAAVEGTRTGQYAAGSKAVFLTAVNIAKGVAASGTSSQLEVEHAMLTLSQALQVFHMSVITVYPRGDANQDGIISIADLGVVVSSYNKTSASPNWASIKSADVNQDGKIDILDLTAVASLIINP
jgi:hypothetical protein